MSSQDRRVLYRAMTSETDTESGKKQYVQDNFQLREKKKKDKEKEFSRVATPLMIPGCGASEKKKEKVAF